MYDVPTYVNFCVRGIGISYSIATGLVSYYSTSTLILASSRGTLVYQVPGIVDCRATPSRERDRLRLRAKLCSLTAGDLKAQNNGLEPLKNIILHVAELRNTKLRALSRYFVLLSRRLSSRINF